MRVLLIVGAAIFSGALLAQSRLPACPPSGVKNNCFGSAIIESGIYIGEFVADKPDGFGNFDMPEIKYSGTFKSGAASGYGEIIKATGERYIGEIKNFVPNGYGTFTHPEGYKYYGEFLQFLPNGRGVMSDGKGQVHEGVFENGRLVRSEAVQNEVGEKILKLELLAQQVRLEREEAAALVDERLAAEAARVEQLAANARAYASAQLARERAATAASKAKKEAAEREEVEKKKKRDNAAKLKSL